MKNKNFGRKRQAIYILSNRKSTRIIKTLMDFFFFIKVKIKMVCFSVPSINGMIRREQETSTDIGLGVMIPHGTEDTLNFVLKPGISIVQIPHGVSYHGNTIHLVIGISSREEDSLQELMQITDILLKPEKCHQFLNASSKQEFIDMINQNYVEEGEL